MHFNDFSNFLIDILNTVSQGSKHVLSKHFWNIENFILLLTGDDSALKVAEEITFQGMVVYKTDAYKNKNLYW